MERIAILSDIHANRSALSAVFNDLEQVGATQLWFLGDLCGYFAQLESAYKELMKKVPGPPEYSVAGNHDWMALGQIPAADAHKRTWESLQYHKEVLERVSHVKEWLESLPTLVSPRPGVYLAHGSFSVNEVERVTIYCNGSSHSGYVTIEQTWQSLCRLLKNAAIEKEGNINYGTCDPPMLMLVGHTHQRGAWQREDTDGHWHEKKSESETPFDSKRPQEWVVKFETGVNKPVLVNPGSVGWPRLRYFHPDSYFWAEYALIEFAENYIEVKFRKIPYCARREIERVKLLYDVDYSNWLLNALAQPDIL